MTTKPARTMTAAQMAWSLKRGFAWAESLDDDDSGYGLGEVIWTRDGSYAWNPMDQLFVMFD